VPLASGKSESGQPENEENEGGDPQEMSHEAEADKDEGQQQKDGDEASHGTPR
jgi:hypothetical protein